MRRVFSEREEEIDRWQIDRYIEIEREKAKRKEENERDLASTKGFISQDQAKTNWTSKLSPKSIENCRGYLPVIPENYPLKSR